MSYRYKEGDEIGEYVVLQMLGQGGMGEVHTVARAEDIQAANFDDKIEEFAAKIASAMSSRIRLLPPASIRLCRDRSSCCRFR